MNKCWHLWRESFNPCVHRVELFFLLSAEKSKFLEFRIIFPGLMDDETEVTKTKKNDEPEVVSEVNTFFLPAPPEVKPLVDPCNRVAKLSVEIPKRNLPEVVLQTSKSVAVAAKKLEVDEDGDLVVPRRKGNTEGEEDLLVEIAIFIEYRNSTPLDAVGLQIWRGSFLLGDCIIENSTRYFSNKVVLELGAGTGISSIVAAMYASRVISTDLDDYGILDLIRANAEHNKGLIRSDFRVEPLDFTNLAWSPQVEEFVISADVILAADVVYHERITEAFVGTLKKILSCDQKRKSKDVFIAMEKRYVFTLADLDTVAPMYAHFLEQLESELNLSPSSSSSNSSIMHTDDGRSVKLNMYQVRTDFKQYFNYEKTKELVLWHISSSPLP